MKKLIWRFPLSIKNIAGSYVQKDWWITMIRWFMPTTCCVPYRNCWGIFRNFTLISAWTRHRIPLKSSMPSLHCWHQDRRIFLWWGMKIRVFMASGQLILRLCSHLKKIIRMQKSCWWKKISGRMPGSFWGQTGLSKRILCVMRSIWKPPENRYLISGKFH